ncbi:nuclease-related domain-containing protein [Candidatus Chloroploca sp. Khr17]|uniref:nuclease-related domain-containing protein n=1 Tax=Candidatus Chloroploca sp. Khr17 TaxID=2496869 RepID=UPI00101D9FD6|nr:nuclease-related domain-containing protein [Candidatus Chloroploca sp. Khr17]
MAVQVWIGEKPEHPNERRVIMALANALHQMEGLYLILSNFSVGGRTIDLVIIKHDAIFILELKQCDGRVIGSVNGPWFVEGRNGERKRLNAGRKNPYNQVISYFHALTNFLNEHRREFLSGQKANGIDFRTCKRAVVIAPAIQEGSEIELDWKVELKGMDELPAYLITERSSEIELTEEEMLAIPSLLHCTPWHEINTVLRGLVPSTEAMLDPDELPAEGLVLAEPSTEAAAAPALIDAPAPAGPPVPSTSLVVQVRQALGTTTGRIAAAMAVLAVLLALALVLRPVRPVPLADDPPVLIVAVTGVPTGDALLMQATDLDGCLWSNAQLVGKSYDPATRSWISVAEGGSAASNPPEVIIALEQVSTCDGQITLTWNVQNNSDRLIEFPLDSDNIHISDSLGNEYLLDETASRPRMIQVAPGAQERGIAVAKRPLSSSAMSLRIRLQDKPFGEASFVVAVQ